MSDRRVNLWMPGELVDRMRELVAKGVYESVDACVEAALAGEPSSWPNLPPPQARTLYPMHNHPTREIRREGTGCPGCDDYHQRQRQRLNVDPDFVSSPAVRCRCCGGRCNRKFRWRGVVRCGCPPQHDNAGVIQADLERQ